jgi:simple sugar transport system permease protein
MNKVATKVKETSVIKDLTGGRKSRIKSNNLLLLITFVMFAVMYIIGCIIYADKGFSHVQTFLNLLITNAGLICVACGMTCVMLTGGIDISVGSLIAMDCMIMAFNMGVKSMPAIPTLLLVLGIGLVFGLAQGFLVGYLDIQPFIITMAGMFFARGMTAVICTDQISITEKSNKMFYDWANTKIYLPAFLGYQDKTGGWQVPYIRPSVIIALLVVVVIFIVLKYTKFGRSLYAVGGNHTSAKMMGLNVKSTKLKAYVLSSFLCSIGGICYCLNTMAGSVQLAKGFEMDAIASSVIGGSLLTGGVGNVIGSLFGVLTTGTIQTLVTTNGKLLSSWANIATAVLLCFFIILQSIFALVKERKKS